ncbi:MAG: hypothetical protein ACD_47C00568G0001 [uncultured bacterium]|nr:MAG: hypothetical protein ACD_47C00568G0001 [uncultured bacterium]
MVEVFAHSLVRLISEHFLGRKVPQHDAVVEVAGYDGVRGQSAYPPEFRFTFDERFFGESVLDSVSDDISGCGQNQKFLFRPHALIRKVFETQRAAEFAGAFERRQHQRFYIQRFKIFSLVSFKAAGCPFYYDPRCQR